MSDTKEATPNALPQNWVRITSVFPGDCIPLNAFVQVSYSNADLAGGAVGLGCGGALAPPDQPVGVGTTGSVTFKLAHRMVAAGHVLTAALKSWGVAVTGDSVSPVSIGNPCAIVISGLEDVSDGFFTLQVNGPLAGSFDRSQGDAVYLLVEQPATDDGYSSAPLLVYADPADVDRDAGTWKHPAIRAARKGMVLRVVLTKDGEVKCTVRAKFV